MQYALFVALIAAVIFLHKRLRTLEDREPPVAATDVEARVKSLEDAEWRRTLKETRK